MFSRAQKRTSKQGFGPFRFIFKVVWNNISVAKTLFGGTFLSFNLLHLFPAPAAPQRSVTALLTGRRAGAEKWRPSDILC